VAAQRRSWRRWQTGVDPRRLVFIDETWAKTNMIRRYGRCPRSQRLVDKAPHGHWKTTTFLAALRHDGLTAPLVVDGAINGAIFLAYVRQQLAPTLRSDDIVILDNLSAHKVTGVREAVEATGARLEYLPPYSPDLNPIEQVFAKLRRLLQRAAARSISALWRRIGELVDCFSPTECSNYIRHCGYRYT
jgi:transposase